MHLIIDHHSGIPVSAQIGQQILYMVVSGELAPRAQLPSVRGLAKELRLNATTVARVYRQLEAEGVVYTQAGRGTYVSPRPPGLTEAEQRRRLTPPLRDLVVEAGTLGVEYEQLQEWLAEEIQAIRDRKVEGGLLGVDYERLQDWLADEMETLQEKKDDTP